MADFDFCKIVREKYGALAGAAAIMFLKTNNNVSESVDLQHRILQKLNDFDVGKDAFNYLRQPFDEKALPPLKETLELSESLKEANVSENPKKAGIVKGKKEDWEDNVVYQILEPDLGEEFTASSLSYLKQNYTDFDSPKNQEKFAELLRNPPVSERLDGHYSLEDQQFTILIAALKIAKIKDEANSKGDVFEYKEMYNNFDRVLEILPPLKEIADDATADALLVNSEELLKKEGKTQKGILDRIAGKDGTARILFYNDIEKRDIGTGATSDLDCLNKIIHSAGCNPVENLQTLCKDIAEQSKQEGQKCFKAGQRMPEIARVNSEERKDYLTNGDNGAESLDVSKVNEGR